MEKEGKEGLQLKSLCLGLASGRRVQSLCHVWDGGFSPFPPAGGRCASAYHPCLKRPCRDRQVHRDGRSWAGAARPESERGRGGRGRGDRGDQGGQTPSWPEDSPREA